MRIKTTFVLILMVLALFPSNSTAMTIDSSHDLVPPAPVFVSLNNTGDPSGSHIYDNNTGITIEYRADRFDVQGVALLGSGSNLTEDLSNMDYVRNFTHVSSFRANSFYEIDLKLTGYTYFYAYAWYGTFENGTMEQLDLFGDAPGHQIWINEGKLYPEFNIENSAGEIRSGDLYVPQYTNTTVQYQVRDHEDVAEYVTLSVAENESAVFDEASAMHWANMTKVNYTTGDDGYDYSIYEYEFNVTLPVMYFSAFNDRGWERASASTSSVNRIETGFNFTTTFSEGLDNYTPLDQIKFNVTTFNATEQSSVGYQYQVFENATTTDDPIKNWTLFHPLSTVFSQYVNDSFDGDLAINATLKQIYSATIADTFEIGNIVEVKTFVKYGQGSNVTSEIFRLEILDPTPTLTISSKNGTLTRFDTRVIDFSFDTPKGEIDTAEITQTLPDNSEVVYDISGKVNQTIDFTNSSNIALEGNHTLVFNITNSLGISKVSTFYYTVDQTEPEGSITVIQPTSGSSNDGIVVVEIDYDDLGISPSGVQLVTIDWGNNMTLNATGLTEVTHKYRKNGVYDIVLTVYDKAGNSVEVPTTVTIGIPSQGGQATNQGSPISVVPIIVSLFFAIPIITRKRR